MASGPVTAVDILRFGDFELDLRAYELRSSGTPLKVKPIPMEMLLFLVERRGQLVTREEIVERIWGKNVFLDTDNSINGAVSRIRRVLRDDAAQPRFLQTVTGKGYRFIAPVEEVSLHPTAAVQTQPPPHSVIGRRVTHYRILELLGGGGMGVVYKAEDLKLGRRVAIKFLPEELATDPHAFRLLEREARAASALDHRNICSVYELDEHEGQPFIVMQLLEGKTLQDLIETAGDREGLPLNEDLDMAIQIAEGLEAAHQKGIIHRDIKPANIFITRRHEVKILDFGLAKMFEGEWDSETDPQGVSTAVVRADKLPKLVPNLRLTLTGINMGTAFYMSPEQIRGEELDQRTDLFSFGLVLYEMVTAHRAFPGNSTAVVHDGILHQEPPHVRQVNPALSPELDGIIMHAIDKDRGLRYQSAAEMLADLRLLGRHASRRPGGSRWIMRGMAAVILCAAMFLAFPVKLPRPELRKDPTVHPLIPASVDHPLMGWVALSPDGKHLAYGDRVSGLSILQVDTGESRSFPNTTAFCPLSWFSDGDHLLLSKVAESGTWKMSTMDGTIRKLHDENFHLFPSPAAQQLAFLDGNALKIEDAGQLTKEVASFGDNWSPIYIAWAPTGHRIAYDKSRQPDGSQTQFEASIGTCDFAGHCSTVFSNPGLATGSDITNMAWLPDGRIVFALRELPPNDESANLWSLDVDPFSGTSSGEPRRLTNWSGVEPKSLSASADGMRLALLQFQTERRIMVAELRAGGTALGKTHPLNSDTWHAVPSGWTHDSRTVLFTGYRHGQKGIFKQSIDNANAEILVSGAERNAHPVLSPDGRWLFYTEFPEGAPPRLMRLPLTGGSPTALLPGDYGYGCAATAIGICVLSELKGNRLVFARLDALKGRGEELQSIQLKNSNSGLLAYAWSLSSDGKRIALVDAGSEDKVHVLEIEGGTRGIVLKGWRHLSSVNWAVDGHHLYISGSKDLAVEQSTFAILETDLSGNFTVLQQVPADRGWLNYPVPSPDGRYLTYTEWNYTSSAVTLEHF